MDVLSEAFIASWETRKKVRNGRISEAIVHALPLQAGGSEFLSSVAEESGAEIRRHWTQSVEITLPDVSAIHLIETT